MQHIEHGDMTVHVTSFTLHSIEVIIEKNGNMAGLEKFLDWVTHTPGLTVYHTTPDEEKEVVFLMEKTKLDFDDALQYYVAKTLDASIISFDRGFNEPLRIRNPEYHRSMNAQCST